MGSAKMPIGILADPIKNVKDNSSIAIDKITNDNLCVNDLLEIIRILCKYIISRKKKKIKYPPSCFLYLYWENKQLRNLIPNVSGLRFTRKSPSRRFFDKMRM